VVIEYVVEVAAVAQPSPEFPGLMIVVETEHFLLAASFAAAVLRARRALRLRGRRGEALALRLATACPVRGVGLAALAEPPANDAFAVRRLALGAMARVSARASVVARAPGRYCISYKTHGAGT